MAAGKTQDQPSVRREERIPVNVSTELLHLGMLTPLVLHRDLPSRVAQIGVRDDATPSIVQRDLDLGLR